MKKNIELQSGMEHQRKHDHIDKAFESQTNIQNKDQRFYYEPMMSGHKQDIVLPFSFQNKKMLFPMWISSMTGGTSLAKRININFAKACKKYGLGMGLGSCRQLLSSDEHLVDFQVRNYCGDEVPLFANLGIAQVEQLIKEGKTSLIDDLVTKLEVDGLFVHINPLQEYLQPEGDRFREKPIDTITRLFDKVKFPIGIKEVGQGMGPRSIEALAKLPLACLELASYGGTNFSRIEQLRSNCPIEHDVKSAFVNLGHSAEEMINYINDIDNISFPIIISGGIKSALDAYFLIQKCQSPAIYGIASRALKPALSGYDDLCKFIELEIEAINIAYSLLDIKRDVL